MTIGRPSLKETIEALGLEPHPSEGGFFRETYRSDEVVAKSALPSRYSSARRFGTAIYYLVTPDSFSSMHRLKSDEVFHFYLGDPVVMLMLHPDGRSETVKLGADIRAGHLLQHTVRRGIWTACRSSTAENTRCSERQSRRRSSTTISSLATATRSLRTIRRRRRS